ncbi:DUF6507 family protein [Streptomyces sp. NPDC007100]|uniref:DUF6507 family protein n=1 Tax=Streptomyces sp. NPDC007100 TaxID=3155602 RepID=UPI0033DD575E
MTKWDIDPGRVASILSLVGLAGDDLSKDVKGYGDHVHDASMWVGTISGQYCGDAPVGPVGVAVADFVSDTERKIQFMAARLKKTLDGTVEATGEYVKGDLAMAADAQQEAVKVPTAAELAAVSEKADGKGGE